MGIVKPAKPQAVVDKLNQNNVNGNLTVSNGTSVEKLGEESNPYCGYSYNNLVSLWNSSSNGYALSPLDRFWLLESLYLNAPNNQIAAEWAVKQQQSNTAAERHDLAYFVEGIENGTINPNTVFNQGYAYPPEMMSSVGIFGQVYLACYDAMNGENMDGI